MKFITDEPPQAYSHSTVFCGTKLLILGGINYEGSMPVDILSVEMSNKRIQKTLSTLNIIEQIQIKQKQVREE